MTKSVRLIDDYFITRHRPSLSTMNRHR